MLRIFGVIFVVSSIEAALPYHFPHSQYRAENGLEHLSNMTSAQALNNQAIYVEIVDISLNVSDRLTALLCILLSSQLKSRYVLF